MTWKSYTVVSGATVLAGWLASTPPAHAPSSSAGKPDPPSRSSSAAASVPSDIEQQALRLQARTRPDRGYAEPHRNPFRFSVARPGPSNGPVEATRPIEPAVVLPPPVLVTLSGVAEDRVGERIERTAILSSPEGVLLVREGEEVLGQYRVATIESEAVQLVKLADGSRSRLSLSNPKSQ